MEETLIRLAILYADVSGSTRIYEQHGDAVARSNIDDCLKILSNVATELDGRTVKTIGDEIMCAFPNPVKAATAASRMQESLREAVDEGRFSIGPLQIKIGWHYGIINSRGTEIIGEAPTTAQQIIKLAKADEVLTSEQSMETLPPELKQDARFINTIEAEAYEGLLNVYALPWEEEAEVTRMGAVSANADEALMHLALVLEYNDRELRMDSDRTCCRIGRGPDNDLCVDGNFTSRQHGEISYRQGRFYLRDSSTNGTAVLYDDGRSVRVHREEEVLSDQGTICFGGLPKTDPNAAVRFRCIRSGE